MRSPRLWSISVGLAGILDCSMALYHLVLPIQMHWREGMVGVADSLVWALFALNFSWSLLLFLVGTLVVHAGRLGPTAGRFAKRTVFTVGLFWMIHGIYTWINVVPLPRSLMWLQYALGLFPVLVVALHWIPLYAYREQAQHASAASSP